MIPDSLGQIELLWQNVHFSQNESEIEVNKNGPVEIRYAYTSVPYETVPDGVDGVLKWYENLKIQNMNVGELKKWLKKFPSRLSLKEAFANIEKQVDIATKALIFVAEEPDLGKECRPYDMYKPAKDKQVKVL